MTIDHLIHHPFGVHRKQRGYPRIKNRGPYRDKLVHRVVVEKLAEEHLTSRPHAPLFLPEGYEVHHMDFNKMHRCPSNLLILDPSIHRAESIAHARNNIRKQSFSDDWWEWQ